MNIGKPRLKSVPPTKMIPTTIAMYITTFVDLLWTALTGNLFSNAASEIEVDTTDVATSTGMVGGWIGFGGGGGPKCDLIELFAAFVQSSMVSFQTRVFRVTEPKEINSTSSCSLTGPALCCS
jgi:hypothetical protein